MSWDGMLPKGTKCKQCGVELNNDGGRPAELYLGTFTGLCYKCEREKPYVVETSKLDGAQKVSHPPMNPSYRRDREAYIGYPGCDLCKGLGAVVVVVSGVWVNSYRRNCPECEKRWHENPERQAHRQALMKLYEDAEAEYHQALRKAKIITKARKGEADQDQIDALRKPIWERYEAERDKLLEKHQF